MAASFRGNDVSYHKELRNHQNVRTDSDSRRGFFEIGLQLAHGRTDLALEVVFPVTAMRTDGNLLSDASTPTRLDCDSASCEAGKTTAIFRPGFQRTPRSSWRDARGRDRQWNDRALRAGNQALQR